MKDATKPKTTNDLAVIWANRNGAVYVGSTTNGASASFRTRGRVGIPFKKTRRQLLKEIVERETS